MRSFRLPIVLLFYFLWATGGFAEKPRLLVFAASSMQDAMLEFGTQYEDICECEVSFSFAASSTLARQIEAGAPADLFISANLDWIKWLEKHSKVSADSSKVIASTDLVVATRIGTTDTELSLLKNGRFAMANPVSVPAGIYGRQALAHLGIWEEVKPNAVFTENVRLALQLVSRGDLDAGIVYQSDLKFAPELQVVHTFERSSHDQIVYLAAVTNAAKEGAGELLEQLVSVEGQRVLEKNGFIASGKVTHD